MDLRTLSYFAALAEDLNFTRTAERLHITQPALSIQIKRLEEEVGAELFAREPRVRLTEAGRVFLEKAKQTIALAHQGADLARRAAAGEIGHLSIGYNNPAGFRVFPKVVPAFKKAKPEIHLTFHDLRVPQQIGALRRGDLDLAFVWLPAPEDEFDIVSLVDEHFIVVLPSEHRLARIEAVKIKDLANEPLIMIPRAADPESYRQIEQLFAHAKAPMRVAYELETLLSILGFVAMGSGVSIVPAYVRDIPRAGIVYKTLKPSPAAKTLAILKRPDSSDLANTFFKFTIESVGASGRAKR